MLPRAKQCLNGAVAGLLATIPMSAVMMAGRRLLPKASQVPLPPAQITKNALRAIDVDDEVSRNAELALTVVNHFGFGGATGALYGSLCAPRSAAHAVATGCIYGLGVWSCSYLGWLPATGLYRSGFDDTRERNTLMIAAHLVWGAGLGLATRYFNEPQPSHTDANS